MLPIPLLLLAGVVSAAPAAELPSIDTPLRTGLSAKGDAAVVIGVEDYAYLPDAAYAARDAKSMYDFLVYTRAIPTGRVSLLPPQSSKTSILEAVAAAGKRVGPDGTVWVYFAGHGAASPTSRERILLPANTLAEEAGFDEAGVSVAELQRRAGAGGGDVIVITDACFTGVGRDGGMLLVNGRAWVPPAAGAEGRAAQWDAVVANQVARPLEPVRHGAFTYFAIGAMRGWADGQVSGKRDGVVTAEEANLYVQEALVSVGMFAQTPSLVGENAEFRTLAMGATERPPVLSAVEVAPAALSPAPQEGRPEVGGTSFVVSSSLSASQKLALQKCDDEARGAADEAHGERLAAAVEAVQSSATTAWQQLEPELTACLELREKADRDACASQAEGFASKGKAAMATLSAHTEVVKTDCGPRERAYAAETASVNVAEVPRAEALAAKLRQVPAPTLPRVASPSPAPAPSVRLGTPGTDWESPTLGTMKWIRAGTFTMGSHATESPREADEAEHRVTLTKGFWLMEHEVTKGEWAAVMGSKPSDFAACGLRCPAEDVSWHQAQAFVEKVSARDGVAYRLPTEAEWEYAARGGEYKVYAGSNKATAVAWVDTNSRIETHAVCGKTRNAYGLCDMSGNVREWVSDWYGAYPGGPPTDPGGPLSGSHRVHRGGSWLESAQFARVADRGSDDPAHHYVTIGFRLARSNP